MVIFMDHNKFIGRAQYQLESLKRFLSAQSQSTVTRGLTSLVSMLLQLPQRYRSSELIMVYHFFRLSNTFPGAFCTLDPMECMLDLGGGL